jgi:hypothetical protein
MGVPLCLPVRTDCLLRCPGLTIGGGMRGSIPSLLNLRDSKYARVVTFPADYYGTESQLVKLAD